jgi:hypothetical protein
VGGKKRTIIVEQKVSKDEFIFVMRKQICEFAVHVQRVKAQYAAISTLKENLPQGRL